MVPSNKTRGNEQKLMDRKFHLNKSGGQSIGVGCPERFWSLPRWRYLRTIWTQSGAQCSRETYLRRKDGPDDLQWTLPTLNHRITEWVKCWQVGNKRLWFRNIGQAVRTCLNTGICLNTLLKLSPNICRLNLSWLVPITMLDSYWAHNKLLLNAVARD